MHRLLALVMVVGCGGAEPAASAVPAEPPPPPPTTARTEPAKTEPAPAAAPKPDQVALGGTGDDPCDGGEVLGADPCAGGEATGGLGIRGTGEGGGGLGSIGTVGGGAGQGTGYGIRGGTPHGIRTLPKVTIGTPKVVGKLDANVVKRAVRRYANQIRYCYEKELAKHPDLAGKVVLDFVISPEGTVVQAKGTGITPEVETCIAGRAMTFTFPKPSKGIVKVSVPITLAPSS